jgi:hypothetical protein
MFVLHNATFSLPISVLKGMATILKKKFWPKCLRKIAQMINFVLLITWYPYQHGLFFQLCFILKSLFPIPSALLSDLFHATNVADPGSGAFLPPGSRGNKVCIPVFMKGPGSGMKTC